MPNTKRNDDINGKLIHVKENIYKIPYRRRNGLPGNRYFIKTKCFVCNKKMLQEYGNSKKGNRPICNHKCQIALQTKPDGSKKYRRGGNEGSVLIKVSNHPLNRKGWVLEHRLLIEKKIGRFLTVKEKVHHVNMISQDNRIKNLYLCSDSTEHNLCHASLNKCVDKLLKSKILQFKKGRYYISKNYCKGDHL